MIKLTLDEMQIVVDYLQIQHDTLFEMIVDKTTIEKDRKEYKKDERALRKFFLAAKEKGLDISKSIYPLAKKLEVLNGKQNANG